MFNLLALSDHGAKMSDTIRAAILEQLINGAEVETAYRQVANEAADALLCHIDRGEKLDEALASLGVACT